MIYREQSNILNGKTSKIYLIKKTLKNELELLEEQSSDGNKIEVSTNSVFFLNNV